MNRRTRLRLGAQSDARLVVYHALGMLASVLAWLSAAVNAAWMRCEVRRMQLDPWLEVQEDMT
jgi:hypothetical protein